MAYFQHLLQRSPDAFILHFTCPARGLGHVTTTLRTPSATKESPTLSLKILTPKFYTQLVTCRFLDTFLTKSLVVPAVENRTAYADDPGRLLRYIRRARVVEREMGEDTPTAANRTTKHAQKGYNYTNLSLSIAWGVLKLVRPRQQIAVGMYPSPGLPTIRRTGLTSTHGEERHVSRGQESGDEQCPYCIDEFVRQEYGTWQQLRYVAAGVMALLREMIVSVVGGA
jgi:hypothetical protein